VAVALARPYANHLHLLQTDNHISISSFNFFRGQMLFLTPNQQCQRTEGKQCYVTIVSGYFMNYELQKHVRQYNTTHAS